MSAVFVPDAKRAVRPSTHPSSSHGATGIVLIVALSIVVFAAAWVGYIGSDDWIYIQNARLREVHPFAVGLDHWDVRVTMTWPMALAFAVFGESEWAAALPTLLATLATSLVVYVGVRRHAATGAAILCAALVATSPLLAIDATSLRVDAIETFFVVASLFCFATVALGAARPRTWLFVAGLAAGLAFITRPTTVALVAFYGVAFLAGRGPTRRRYVELACGFLAIWLAESVFYAITTGHFFHRLDVDFHHDQVVRGGNLFTAAVLEPLKLLLTSHSLGFAFWLAPFALASWWRRPRSPARGLVGWLALFALVWIVVFASFATKLVLDARYLAPATVAALTIDGLWIFALFDGRRGVAVGLGFLLFASHALAIELENKDFLYAERWLMKIAATSPEPIYTDPQTYERGLFLFELANVKPKIVPEPAPPGALYLAVPLNAARGQYNTRRWDPRTFDANPAWPAVERLDPGHRALGSLLEASGLARLLPGGVWKKIDQPNDPLVLYRRPPEAASSAR